MKRRSPTYGRRPRTGHWQTVQSRTVTSAVLARVAGVTEADVWRYRLYWDRDVVQMQTHNWRTFDVTGLQMAQAFVADVDW